MNIRDIYLANVPFEDLPMAKCRPVLILTDKALMIDCLKMTGQKPRQGEYVLRDWEKAGLKKPTVVRISKRISLPQNAFIKKIGTISEYDAIKIAKLLEQTEKRK